MSGSLSGLLPAAIVFKARKSWTLPVSGAFAGTLAVSIGKRPRLGQARSSPDMRRPGADFDFSFTVPEADGCPAQYVWLNFDARWASEQFISGAVWFDDLQIERQTVDNH